MKKLLFAFIITFILAACSNSITDTTLVLAAPTIYPNGGTIYITDTVILSGPEGATIYYTINNSEPSARSIIYTNAFALAEGTHIIKAIAIKNEDFSSVITAFLQWLQLGHPLFDIDDIIKSIYLKALQSEGFSMPCG